MYYIPLYFQLVRGETTIRSAVDILPLLTTATAAMLVSGLLMTSAVWCKLWFVTGSALALIIAACLYKTGVNTEHGNTYSYLVQGGNGTGVHAMNAGPVMSAIVEKERAAGASTIIGCVDSICGAVLVGIANAMCVTRATSNIQRILPDSPRAVVRERITGVGASLTGKPPPARMIATAALSLILSVLLRNEK